MTTTRADGDLLIDLNPTDLRTYKQPRGATPSTGSTVRLWRLPGKRYVWSEGPEAGTWWVRSITDDAREVAELIATEPSRGSPVVKATWKDCIAVRSKDIRPAAL